MVGQNRQNTVINPDESSLGRLVVHFSSVKMNVHRPPRIPQNHRHCPRQFQWTHYGPRPSGPFQGNASPRPNNFNFRRQHITHEEYWCETCDRGFSTKDQLDKHSQQHQVNNLTRPLILTYLDHLVAYIGLYYVHEEKTKITKNIINQVIETGILIC